VVVVYEARWDLIKKIMFELDLEERKQVEQGVSVRLKAPGRVVKGALQSFVDDFGNVKLRKVF
jgi:hypothetical protein